MQRVFGTAALDGPSVLLAALAGAVVLPVITLEKRLRARASRRAPPAASAAAPPPPLARAAR
jgi:hypothetical protein